MKVASAGLSYQLTSLLLQTSHAADFMARVFCGFDGVLHCCHICAVVGANPGECAAVKKSRFTVDARIDGVSLLDARRFLLL